jgi:hypothetical protein
MLLGSFCCIAMQQLADRFIHAYFTMLLRIRDDFGRDLLIYRVSRLAVVMVLNAKRPDCGCSRSKALSHRTQSSAADRWADVEKARRVAVAVYRGTSKGRLQNP